MGKPLMIHEDDDNLIEELKKEMGAKTKIEIVRSALILLKEKLEKRSKIEQWKKAARLSADSSYEVLKDFQPYSRLKKNG